MGLIQLVFCFVFEFINMIILFAKPDVYLTIISYITVSLLTDLSKIYYNKTIDSDLDDVMKTVFNDENLLEYDKKGTETVYE